MEISTSILSVKEEKCVETFYDLEVAKTDYFHIDVMDGVFVNNNTKEQMRKYSEILKNVSNVPLDVHLMAQNVKEFLDEYIPLHPAFITIHYEAFKDKNEMMNIIHVIKENGIKCGISIKPNTKIEDIFEILPYIHLVLIMTVEPGQGGQKLIPECVEKIIKLKEYIENNKLDIFIEADGGINEETIELIRNAKTDIVVSGSAIINSENYKDIIQKLR